jgi:hypothetical protein
MGWRLRQTDSTGGELVTLLLLFCCLSACCSSFCVRALKAAWYAGPSNHDVYDYQSHGDATHDVTYRHLNDPLRCWRSSTPDAT